MNISCRHRSISVSAKVSHCLLFSSRAWHQAHVPSATIRLATHYLPVHAIPPELLSMSGQTPSTPTNGSPDTTPVTSHSTIPYVDQTALPIKGTMAYYIDRVGGASNLAVLYLEAGLLYLEGSASNLLSSSYSGLSSLRTPTVTSHPPPYASSHHEHGGTDAWHSDQGYARRFFNRARELYPALDVPLLPTSNPSSEPESGDNENSPVLSSEPSQTRLRMPTVDTDGSSEKPVRRRRRRDTVVASDDLAASINSKSAVGDHLDGPVDDNTWYLYLPGLVGAGTALLVVGFLSFSSWRKGQGT